MNAVLKYGLTFAGGVVGGLLLAKYVLAPNKVNSLIGSALGSVGLGGGEIQSVVEGLADKAVTS